MMVKLLAPLERLDRIDLRGQRRKRFLDLPDRSSSRVVFELEKHRVLPPIDDQSDQEGGAEPNEVSWGRPSDFHSIPDKLEKA